MLAAFINHKGQVDMGEIYMVIHHCLIPHTEGDLISEVWGILVSR